MEIEDIHADVSAHNAHMQVGTSNEFEIFKKLVKERGLEGNAACIDLMKILFPGAVTRYELRRRLICGQENHRPCDWKRNL